MDINDMTYGDARRIVEEIRQYLGSQNGQRELTKALERADESCERRREASRVGRKELDFVIDI